MSSANRATPLDPVLVVGLFPDERKALLNLVSRLSVDDWKKPTSCPGWSVKDIAQHILGDDLSWLSRHRDAFAGAAFVHQGGAEFEAALLAFISEANETWVRATRRLSPRLLGQLLRFTGEETQRYFRSLDPYAIGEPVSWAGPEPAPVWLGLAREYTERWHHQQQIRDAVGKPGLKEPHLFSVVLDTFVRALPHTFRRVKAPAGTQIKLIISGEAGGEWTLARRPDAWTLHRDATADLAAVVLIDQETAWRLFTKNIAKSEALARSTITGDRRLALKVLDTVSIVA